MGINGYSRNNLAQWNGQEDLGESIRAEVNTEIDGERTDNDSTPPYNFIEKKEG